MTGLVGRQLALAAHPLCKAADPEQEGLKTAAIIELLDESGHEIGGRNRPQVLRTALNNSQDLFRIGANWTWFWIEPVDPEGEGLSGLALAEEAYRLMMRSDPERNGMHYEAIKQLLLDNGVIIRGTNSGKTVFRALSNAKQWFEWTKSATFRWK